MLYISKGKGKGIIKNQFIQMDLLKFDENPHFHM